MEITLGELTEVQLRPKDSGTELALVTWVFSSGAEIRGGRISRSKFEPFDPWVQLPKFRSRNMKWVNTIRLRLEDEAYLEEQALQRYRQLSGL